MKKMLVLFAILTPGVASAQIEVRLTVPQVRVRVAPPPVRVEVQPQRQSPDQIWIAGYWARRGDQNVWMSGAWRSPPQEGMVWEKERWSQRDGAWYYAEGHWRWATPPAPTVVYDPPSYSEQVVVERAPPRSIAERRTPSPFRGAVWISGYWGWDGEQHRWVAGRWSAPQARAQWTPARWTRADGERDGRKQHWVLQQGHWNRNRNHR